MAKPKNKEELLTSAAMQYTKLLQIIDSFEDPTRDFKKLPEGKEVHWKRDINIRDVLIHLYEWHQLILHWVANQQKGNNVPFLPTPYTWKNYGQMNIDFWYKHQNTTYENARKMLMQSHQDIIDLVDTFSNEALFTKQYFSWSGTSSVGQYCISATASHYDWAIKKLRKIQKLSKGL
jgi:hypothetical protein